MDLKEGVEGSGEKLRPTSNTTVGCHTEYEKLVRNPRQANAIGQI